jgi:transcriptional regulator GlxA family with amidase domain
MRAQLVKVFACGVMVVMATGTVVVAVGVLTCGGGRMQMEMWTEVVSRRFRAAVAVAEGGG